MAGPTIQANYSQYPDHGYPGLCALPDQPTIIERGILSGTASPGDALWFDPTGTNGAWKKVTASEVDEPTAILSYDQSAVQNSSDQVSFSDGDEIKVGIMGAFWATAGGPIKYGMRVKFDLTDSRWVAIPKFVIANNTNQNNLLLGDDGFNGSLFTSATKLAVSDGGLFIVRISSGIGRVYWDVS